MDRRIVCHRCARGVKPVNGKLACPADGRDINDHAAEGVCPRGYYDGGATVPLLVKGDATQSAPVWGPPLWDELHRWALAYTGTPDDKLRSYSLKIPCGECRRDWLRIIKDVPPPKSAAEMFGWSVAVHNVVNRKLGKPEMGEAEARAIYLANE
jgi:hypothetical protein